MRILTVKRNFVVFIIYFFCDSKRVYTAHLIYGGPTVFFGFYDVYTLYYFVIGQRLTGLNATCTLHSPAKRQNVFYWFFFFFFLLSFDISPFGAVRLEGNTRVYRTRSHISFGRIMETLVYNIRFGVTLLVITIIIMIIIIIITISIVIIIFFIITIYSYNVLLCARIKTK